MAQYLSSTSVLQGALRINYSLPDAAALQDLGGKVAFLISAINTYTSALSYLNAQVTAINSALVSAANSAVTFSAFSTAPSAVISIASYTGAFTNFTSN